MKTSHYAGLALIVNLLCSPAGLCASDALTVATTVSSTEVRGPRVEIVPLAGRSAYRATLLDFTGGVLNLQIENGEHRQEKSEDVKSLRFLAPPVAPPAPVIASSPSPALPPASEKHSNWTQTDGARLKSLWQKEHDGSATAAEDDEFKKLRERAPAIALLGALTPGQRVHTAERIAKSEYSRGRIYEHIATLQRKLKKAQSDDEALAAIWMLAFAYRQAGYQKLGDQLHGDAVSMQNPELRKAMIERVPEIVANLYALRADQKSESKK